MVRCFWASVAVVATAGCLSETTASSQSQRRIGEARLQEGLFATITFGAVRAFTETELVVRQASPTVRLTIESGAEVEEALEVELRNVHLDASLRVVTASFLDGEDQRGCPVTTGVDVDCIAAAAAVGNACETSGECPEGLRCAMSSCQPSDLFVACVPPDFERLEGQETSLSFVVDVQPCRRIQLETFLDSSLEGEPLRFAVVGPTTGDEILLELRDQFRAADVDFVVLLGDNAPSADERGLGALERTSIRLGAPVVVVAGPRELEASEGEEFLRRFGPHDHTWSLKGARFFSFYTALGALGPRGFERLDTFLVELNEGLDPADPPGPLVGVTHTPPLDPDGLRDGGFRSDVEGARVVSLLQQHGVHQLYAGSLGTGEVKIHDTDVVVTTARGTLANPAQEWILVEMLPRDQTEEGRVVGDRALVVTRHPIVSTVTP